MQPPESSNLLRFFHIGDAAFLIEYLLSLGTYLTEFYEF
jgi:hypothetical protein